VAEADKRIRSVGRKREKSIMNVLRCCCRRGCWLAGSTFVLFFLFPSVLYGMARDVIIGLHISV